MNPENRYMRQTILPEIGMDGQARLKQARVLCIGAGGLASPVLLYLAASGIGTLGIVDADTVSVSNLQRQIIYQTEDAGIPKAKIARERLLRLNPEIQVNAYIEDFTITNAPTLCHDYDILIDTTDNFPAKFLINDVGVKYGLPVVYGSISGFEGQTATFWSQHGPCYRCLYPQPPRQSIPNCAEAGVIGAVAGIIGTLQALEAIKLALGRDHCARHGLEIPFGRLFTFDLRNGEYKSLHLSRRAGCPCHNPETIVLKAETAACATDKIPELTWHEAATRHDLIYIDVRETDEWEMGHIDGAVHLPLSSLQTLQKLPTSLNPNREYAIYCLRGLRGQRAVALLAALGLNRAVNITGGLDSRPILK